MAIKDGKFIDKKSIKELVEILDEMNLSNLSYQKGDVSISVSKGALVPLERSTNNEESSNKTEELDYKNDPRVVKSPMVGTVYLQAEPGSPAFVSVGSTVAEGDTILIIEAMKTMNQIPAPHAGIIKRILVEDGGPVEFGSPLVIIE